MEKFGLVLEKEEANDELLVELEKAEESKYFPSMEIFELEKGLLHLFMFTWYNEIEMEEENTRIRSYSISRRVEK